PYSNALDVVLCNASPTTALVPLSLHDALPISDGVNFHTAVRAVHDVPADTELAGVLLRKKPVAHALDSPRNDVSFRDLPLLSLQDRKSTRLNSSHEWISYAVFCLKKKKKNEYN